MTNQELSLQGWLHVYDKYPYNIYLLWSCFLHHVILIWLWKYCFVGATSPFKANHIIFIHGDKAAIWVVSLLFTLVILLFTLAWMSFRSFHRHQYSCCSICFIFINTFSCIAHSKKVKSVCRSFCFAPYLTVCFPASVVQVSSCSRISAWTRSTRPFHSWSFMRR